MEKARLVEVIITDALRGEGVQGDPVRRDLLIFTKDGRLVATVEPGAISGAAWDLLESGESR
jgi:hypothetical protein